MSVKQNIGLYYKKIKDKLTAFSKAHWFWSNAILAFITVFIVEFFNRLSLTDTISYMVLYFPSALMNILIVLTFLMLPPVSKRHVYWKYFVCTICILMGIVNFVLFNFRMLPFNYTDILLIPSTISVIPYYLTTWQICLIVVAIVAIVVLFVFVYRKIPKKESNVKKGLVCFLIMFAITFGYYFLATSTGAINNRVAGLKNKYYHNGFLYCFTSSAVDTGMRQPDDYSSKKVADIVKDLDNTNKDKAVNANIIFLQLESFYDPNLITNYTYSENPVPVFTDLKNNYSHGYLNVPTFSAGTANTEFEIITGMNIDFFGIGEYPYRTVIEDKAVDSAPFCLRDIGYKSHAIHNNTAVFYERDSIYANLGFDTFTSLEYMYDVEFNSMGWAKDITMVKSILDCMESSKGPDLIYTVGVQTHGAYPDETPKSPYKITVGGISDESSKNSFEYYVNELHEVDSFVGSLISELKLKNEPTVLVVFGDHMPGFEIEDQNLESKSIYETEYAIWSNFDMDMTIKNLQCYQLYSYVLDRLNISGGTISKLHQRYSYKDSEEYMNDFELLQYDLIYGEKVGFGGKDYKPTKLKFGVLPIKIDNINEVAGNIYIHGSNFNNYTWVYVNDQKVETRYVNSQNIIIDKNSIKKGDKVHTSQLDENSEVISTSNSIKFE